MLIKMARMFGQPVDQALIESVEREEKLAAALFKEEKKPTIIGYPAKPACILTLQQVGL